MFSLLVFEILFILNHLNGQEIMLEHKCGVLSVEDIPAAHTKIPWTAIIQLRTETQPEKLYPGTILSPTMILMNANLLLSGENKKLIIHSSSDYRVHTNTTSFSANFTPNTQINEITHIRVHPKYTGIHKTHDWTTALYDFAILHLKVPIPFDSFVHSICVPTLLQMEQILYSWENTSVSKSPFTLLSGWRRQFTEQLIVLRMSANKQAKCKEFWFANPATQHMNYIDRICANTSSENSHTDCVNNDIGVFIQIETQFYMVGFVNNFYWDNGMCNRNARFFISHHTKGSLDWIRQNQRCGPNHFTCTNGECILLRGSLCNQIPQCSDSSDEDPYFCPPLTQCNQNQFPCGLYGECINKTRVCDGIQDCTEAEDESNCSSQRYDLLTVLLPVLGIVILIATLGIFLHRKGLKREREKLRELDDDEVEEFEHGSRDRGPAQPISLSVNNHYENTIDVGNFAWDAHRFEIPKANLNMKKGNPLGSGVGGTVYPGVLRKQDDSDSDKTVEVAIKIFNESGHTQNFKALLSELKIMTRVGGHENIVNLIGAYTREIKQRVLYVVLELCHKGDLESYLKRNRHSFISTTVDILENKDISPRTDRYENSELLKPSFTLENLRRWSYEIANGMEYLASLHIVHGDLATRNVLLTSSLSAKISDFGLSRNLYESAIYVKKGKAPLPWRWMAIESLRDLEFSSTSDVWAYGVTLWEIYSLGAVPYPGLGWSPDFVTQLIQGLRMSQPSHASTPVYNCMLDCWTPDSTQRPTFTQLKQFFNKDEEISTSTAQSC